MIFQNVSGASLTFGFGSHGAYTLANNATRELPETVDVLTSVLGYVNSGTGKVTQGPASLAQLASVDQPANGFVNLSGAASTNDTVTVAGLVFEFEVDPGGAVLGAYNSNLTDPAYVWAGAGAAAATAAATLRTAINNNSTDLGVKAGTLSTVNSKQYIPIVALDNSIVNTGLTLAKSGTNIAVSAATLAAGAYGAARAVFWTTYTASAGDVTEGAILINTGLTSISSFEVRLILSSGVPLAYNGVVQAVGGTIALDNSGTGADFAAGTTIFVLAFGLKV